MSSAGSCLTNREMDSTGSCAVTAAQHEFAVRKAADHYQHSYWIQRLMVVSTTALASSIKEDINLNTMRMHSCMSGVCIVHLLLLVWPQEYAALYTRPVDIILGKSLFACPSQELKGNIRVFCRVRPELPADGASAATAEPLMQFPSSGMAKLRMENDLYNTTARSPCWCSFHLNTSSTAAAACLHDSCCCLIS